MRYVLPILFIVILPIIAFPFQVGPSVKYLIIGSGSLHELQSVLYEQSVSSILFCNSEILLFGVQLCASISEEYTLGLSGYWNNYVPHYVTPPENGHYSLNRSGSISVYTCGVQRSFGRVNAKLGAEAYYFSESWDDPFTGVLEYIDSLAFSPSLSVGTIMEVSPGAVTFEMGLTFPEFDSVWGMISLGMLFP